MRILLWSFVILSLLVVGCTQVNNLTSPSNKCVQSASSTLDIAVSKNPSTNFNVLDAGTFNSKEECVQVLTKWGVLSPHAKNASVINMADDCNLPNGEYVIYRADAGNGRMWNNIDGYLSQYLTFGLVCSNDGTLTTNSVDVLNNVK